METEHVTSALSFSISVDDTLLELSPDLARVLGYERDELLGKSHASVLSFDPLHKASWYLLTAGEHQFIKVRLVRKAPMDGLSVFCCFSPVHDVARKLVAVRACCLDVAPQMTEGFASGAELDALKQSQAVACFGLDGVFLEGNQKFLDMLGFTREELSGKYHKDLVTPTLANSKEFEGLWKRLCGGECLSEVITHVGKDGKEIGMFAIYAPVLDVNGKPWKVVMYGGDMHQHKAEEQAKSLFLTNLSRELRAPLNAIFGVVDFVKTTVPYPSYRNVLDISLRSAESLLAVLDVVVASESRALVSDRVMFNLNSVIEGVLLLVATGKSPDVEVTSCIQTDVPMVLLGDPSLLRQVLFCLLSNGVRFTRMGEVCLEVSVESLDQLIIKFEVCDSGIGIAEDNLKTLFVQTAGARNPKPTVRLGLRTCKEMVGLLKGEIRVKSRMHRGSTFTFTAMFERGEDKHSLAHSLNITDAEVQILSRLKVLVIDANATVGAALLDLFKCLGCKAVVATRSKKDGVDHLRAASLKGEPFDVVVLDIRIDIVEDVKRFELRSVFVGLVDEGQSTDEAVFSGFVPKPIRRGYLLKLVCSLCRAPAKLKAKTKWRTSARDDPVDIGVLVADDDSVSLELLSTFLRRNNFRVVEAVNGADALEKLNGSIDVVVIDAHMSLLDGPEAIQILRSWGCVVPVIVITGDVGEATKAKCEEAGALKVIYKPVNYDQLADLIRSVALVSRSKVHTQEGRD